MHAGTAHPGNDDVGTVTRLLLLAAGLAHTGLAGLAIAALQTWPWTLAPLHTACLAAMQAAAALPWILAWRESDSAALRIPVAQMLAGSAGTVLLTALRLGELAPLAPRAWAWLAMHAVMAALAAAWLSGQSDIQAPAERPDRGLRVAGALAVVAALLLAATPALAARLWPWPLAREAGVLYASALAGWAVALLKLARERRRDARRPALWGLGALGALVGLASWSYRTAFHHPVAGLAWAALFVALTVLAGQRLARPGRRWPGIGVRPARPSDR